MGKKIYLEPDYLKSSFFCFSSQSESLPGKWKKLLKFEDLETQALFLVCDIVVLFCKSSLPPLRQRRQRRQRRHRRQRRVNVVNVVIVAKRPISLI